MKSKDKYKVRKYLKDNMSLKGFFKRVKSEIDIYLSLSFVVLINSVFLVMSTFLLSRYIPGMEYFSTPISMALGFIIWYFIVLFGLSKAESKLSANLKICTFWTLMTFLEVSVTSVFTLLLSSILPFWLSLSIGSIFGILSILYPIYTIITYLEAVKSEDLNKSDMRDERLDQILGGK